MHKTLQTQLSQCDIKLESLSEPLKTLLEVISQTYEHADEHRGLTEGSLELPPSELGAVNKQLKENNEHLSIVFNNLTDAVGLLAVENETTFRFLIANQLAIGFTGLTPEQIVGKTFTEVFQNIPDTVEKGHGQFKQVLDAKKPLTFIERIPLPQAELIMESTITPILSNGIVTHVLAVSKNVTEKKLAEEKLAKSEREFRSLAENVPDIIARFDKNLKYLYINPKVELLTGKKPDEFHGKTNFEVGAMLGMPNDLLVRLDEILKKTFTAKQPQSFEFSFTSAQKTIYFDSRAVPEIGADNQVETILVINHDITNRKDAEQKEKKKTEELERLNQSMVGRELKMIELKKEIERLRALSGNGNDTAQTNTASQQSSIPLEKPDTIKPVEKNKKEETI